MDYQFLPAQNRAQRSPDTGDMPVRHRKDHRVARIGAVPVDIVLFHQRAEMGAVVVAQHHTLGQAGGARCVQLEQAVMRIDFGGDGCVRLGIAPCVETVIGQDCVAIERQLIGEFRLHKQHACARIL